MKKSEKWKAIFKNKSLIVIVTVFVVAPLLINLGLVLTDIIYEEFTHKKSGLPLKKFFNTSGLVYKEMQLKDKLPSMSEEEQLKLLATNGMLVKRPMLITDDKVLVGFKEAEWEVLL